jgi:hypothetical protein
MCSDLTSDCSSAVIKSHIEFNSLPRPQWWLALYNLIRNEQQVIPMHEEIAIESCRV